MSKAQRMSFAPRIDAKNLKRMQAVVAKKPRRDPEEFIDPTPSYYAEVIEYETVQPFDMLEVVEHVPIAYRRIAADGTDVTDVTVSAEPTFAERWQQHVHPEGSAPAIPWSSLADEGIWSRQYLGIPTELPEDEDDRRRREKALTFNMCYGAGYASSALRIKRF